MKLSRYFPLILFSLVSCRLLAWKPWPLPMDSADTGRDTLFYEGKWGGVVSSGRFAPFWLSTNTYGTVSPYPFSTYLRAGIDKPAVRDARWWDYSYGLDLVGGVDSRSWYGRVVSLFGHVRLWCFDISAGWRPHDYGNQDYDLSAGGFLFSRNAPTMPEVSVGIDKYTAFPFTYGYLEVKGAIRHAWSTDRLGAVGALVHHKYIGVRLGGKLPVTINYEFHHVAQWGGRSEKYGELGSSIHDFWTIFRAASGGVNSSDQINALGNHIGSQMLGIDFRLKGWHLKAYWQNIFEDGPVRPIWNTMNIYDGLWGVSLKQSSWPFISGILYEFLATTDQSGPVHDMDGVVFGGNDSYFNNSIYTQGWTHYAHTIGTPFITSPIYTSSLSTLNNRTFTHHVALKGDIYGFEYTLRYSHSKNYGTYGKYLYSYNNGCLLSVNKTVAKAWNLNFGLSVAADFGSQFGNSVGAMITVAKRGIIY